MSITNEIPAPIRTPNEIRLQAEVDHLASQINQLAKWFRVNAPERIIEGGAVDVAIETLEFYRNELRQVTR